LGLNEKDLNGKGRAFSRNLIITHSSKDIKYIVFIDADCVVSNNWLAILVQRIEKIKIIFRELEKKLGINIEYFIENEPIGTAGGLKFLEKENMPVIVLYGDVYIDFK